MSLSNDEQRLLDELEKQFHDDQATGAAPPGRAEGSERRRLITRCLLAIGAAVFLLGLNMISDGMAAGMIVTVYGVLALTGAAVISYRSRER